jgi:GntR family transcriptional regulator
MLNKDSSIPLHIQLAGSLRNQMARKELHPHSRLPSERELCEQYGISRITVRKALSTLVQEGLVYSTIGKGTYVSEPGYNEELQPLSSFTQDLQRRGVESSSWVLNMEIVPADDEISAVLHIFRGTEVVRLHRLRLANGLPIAIQMAHLPHHLCRDLARFDFSSRSLFEVLQSEYGLILTRTDTVIEAALANPEEADLLQLTPPAAVLTSLQTTYLDNGAVIEFTRSVFHAERYKLHTHA